MPETTQDKHGPASLRVGAACAVLGSIVSVAAGAGFGNLTNTASTEAVLRHVSSGPGWYWPTIYLGFVLGALLWVGAFALLADSLQGGASHALGRLGAAVVIVGATVHVVDSCVGGAGLARLADGWAAAHGPEKATLLQTGDAMLAVLHGTWAGVLLLFHGLPFVLAGLAMVLDRTYPAWLGWVGVVGGAGSIVAGTTMFLGSGLFAGGLYVPLAIVVSVWMVAMGALMWRRVPATHNPTGG